MFNILFMDAWKYFSKKKFEHDFVWVNGNDFYDFKSP